MMSACKTGFLILAVNLIVLLIATSHSAAKNRVALVIGNQSYANTSDLYNPVKDAKDVASALRRLDFEVTEHLDISLDKMRKAVISFGRLARRSDMAVIYFAGHGMEMGGENWLIPVDAHLISDIDVEDEAIGLSYVMGKLRGSRKLSLIILDACRNNPFASRIKRTSGVSRAVSRGFARIEPEENLLVAYAAREGTLADDGTTGENSPYAAALLKHLETPNIDVRILFGKIRDEVKANTEKRQIPHTYGSLPGHRILLNYKSDAKKPSTVSIESEESKKLKQFEHAKAKWNIIRNTDNPIVIRKFLTEFPVGMVSSFAKFKLEQLELANRKLEKINEQNRRLQELEKKERQLAASLRREEKLEQQRVASLRQKEELEQQRVASLRQNEELEQQRVASLRRIEELEQQRVASLRQKEELEQQRIASLRNIEKARNKVETETVTTPRIVTSQIIRSIQTDFNRLGCNAGTPDGKWGRKSINALSQYSKHANKQYASVEPTIDLHDDLRSIRKRVCPLTCDIRHVVENDLCVLKSCPSGQRLSKRGVCFKPKTKSASTRVQKSRPPTKRSKSNSNCFMFDGKRFCE